MAAKLRQFPEHRAREAGSWGTAIATGQINLRMIAANDRRIPRIETRRCARCMSKLAQTVRQASAGRCRGDRSEPLGPSGEGSKDDR